MAKYVIGPDVAIQLARDKAVISGEHQILAPALLRSQLLSLLYQVRRGEMTKKEAGQWLSYIRGVSRHASRRTPERKDATILRMASGCG
jgi:hypothetical protein